MTWCERCDWNVDPSGAYDPPPEWRRKWDHRLADALYREVDRGAVRRPGRDAARVAAYLLALLLLLLPVAGLVGGIALLVFYRPLWLSVPLAAIAFGTVLLLRPRANRLDPDAQLVSREQAPRLYDVLDRIAAAIGTPPVQAVVVDTEPDLWFARIGWRFRPVVGIGLPLWVALGPQERVAVLAHELGHGKNGDARHGWVVHTARTILGELEQTFTEQPLDEARRDLGYHVNAHDEEAYVNLVTRIVNATMGRLVRGYRWLLDRADLRASQRAEYLADLKAGEIAGPEATARALERLLMADTCYDAMERSMRFHRELDPLDAARQAVSRLPAREIERRTRASRARETRTDATHPPTCLRIRLLRARPAASASVVLGLSDNATIDRELATAGSAALNRLRREFPVN